MLGRWVLALLATTRYYLDAMQRGNEADCQRNSSQPPGQGG